MSTASPSSAETRLWRRRCRGPNSLLRQRGDQIDHRGQHGHPQDE
ncbi:hypothetical protein ACFPRL_17055 [Pseudoclavibacter helvolus]